MIGVIGIFVAIPGVLLVANVPVLGVVLAGMLLYGFTRPFPDANMVPILCQIVDPRYLATGVGLLNMFAVLRRKRKGLHALVTTQTLTSADLVAASAVAGSA